jgi:hypothetical protein
LRYPLLALVGALIAVRGAAHGRGDWPPFASGSRALFEHGGLRVFAERPGLLLGPVALVAIRAFLALGGYWVMVAVGCVAGPMLILVIERTALRVVPDRETALTVLLGGAVFIASWMDLVLYGHVDDALVLSFAAVAMWSCAARRPALAGVMLGLAFGSKQWAVVLLPLVLAFEGRARFKAAGWALGIAVAVWAPFLLADLHTVNSARNLVAADSTLKLLGFSGLSPWWWRAVQLSAAFAAAAWVVNRGWWWAMLLVATGVRIALDPATWDYYAAGLVLGAFAFELIGSKRLVPWWTLGAFLFVAETTLLSDSATGRAWVRLLFVATAVVWVGCMRARTSERGA